MTTFALSVEQIELRKPVAVLHIYGRVDASNYLQLIASAQTIYAAGTRRLILDMHEVTRVSSAGLMALHSIAALFRGKTPLDPEAGWDALHAIAEDLDEGSQPYVKLLNPQPQVRQVLDLVGFSMYFDIQTDLEAALAAWDAVGVDAETV